MFYIIGKGFLKRLQDAGKKRCILFSPASFARVGDPSVMCYVCTRPPTRAKLAGGGSLLLSPTARWGRRVPCQPDLRAGNTLGSRKKLFQHAQNILQGIRLHVFAHCAAADEFLVGEFNL